MQEVKVNVGGIKYKSIPELNKGNCKGCVANDNIDLCCTLSQCGKGCSVGNYIFDLDKEQPSVQQDEYDIVSKPKHYMLSIKEYNIEVRDVCKALANRLSTAGYTGMFISDYVQMLQYLMRFDAKNGKEDLEKASWYLTKLIEEYDSKE